MGTVAYWTMILREEKNKLLRKMFEANYKVSFFYHLDTFMLHFSL